MKRRPPKANSLFPLSFLFHCLIWSHGKRDNTPPYPPPRLRVLSIITSIASSNYRLIVVSKDKTAATLGQRINSCLFFDASHFAPPTKVMPEGGADEGAPHQQGGNVWVRQQWRQWRFVAKINDNKGSNGGGEESWVLTWFAQTFIKTSIMGCRWIFFSKSEGFRI